MAVLFALILLCHIPGIYASGGVYLANAALIVYVTYTALSTRQIKRWPLLVLFLPLVLLLLEVLHGLTLKGLVAFISIFAIVYVFPTKRVEPRWLRRQVKAMVVVSLAFLFAHSLLNLQELASLSFVKERYQYVLATPNLTGFLAAFVIIVSWENRFHPAYYILGAVSLLFMPMFFGTYLVLLVFLLWRLPKLLSVPIVLAALSFVALTISWETIADPRFLLTATSNRFGIWVNSITVLSNSAWLGFGLEQWEPLLGYFINPHNFVIYFVLCYGYVIGGLFASVTVYLVLQKRENPRANAVILKPFMVSLLIYQCVYVGALGHFSTFGNLLVLFYGLFLCKEYSERGPQSRAAVNDAGSSPSPLLQQRTV